MHDPTLWHLRNNSVFIEVTHKLWHLLRLETYESIVNNRLQTFVLKTCINLLPILQYKERRYNDLYNTDEYLYGVTASDSQKHWIMCQNMQYLWLSTLYRTLLRLMIHIKWK